MFKKGYALIAAILFIGSVEAQEGYGTALGIRISSQNAIVNHAVSLKHFFTESAAGELLVSFGDPGAIGALVEVHKTLGSRNFTWYWGAGPYLGFNENYRLGFQGALGLDLKLPGIPFALSADWKPEWNLTKVFSFEPAAVGISARYVFR